MSKQARFEAFVHAHRERAVRLAWRLVGGDEQVAREVAQDAFAKAWRGLDDFRDEASLHTWFTRIVVRQAANHRRWWAVRVNKAQLLPLPQQAPDRDPLLARRIGQAVGSLSQGQREAFVLCQLEGLSTEEAAEILGKAPGTVKIHLHRARGRLRVLLADLEPSGSDR